MPNKSEERILREQKSVIQRLSMSYRHRRIGHAYLFDGERGTGKEAIALFFAKLLLCESPQHDVPCETCTSCRRVTSGNHPNVSMIRPDGQEIKKEQMVQLIYQMNKKGFEPGRKIYIITRADRMNMAASNTLLKFLEEPEGEVTAILLAESYQAVLPTIQSRCQRISFLPPSREARIEELVAKGVTTSMAATVTMLTANHDEAFQLAEDVQFAQMRKTVLKLIEASNQHVHEALLFIQTDWLPLFKEKVETERGLDLLLFALQDIVAYKARLSTTPTFPDYKTLLENISMKKTYSQLSAAMEVVLQSKKQLHGNMNRTLLMEQVVLNMQEGLMLV